VSDSLALAMAIVHRNIAELGRERIMLAALSGCSFFSLHVIARHLEVHDDDEPRDPSVGEVSRILR
jgi:hypothetical protein